MAITAAEGKPAAFYKDRGIVTLLLLVHPVLVGLTYETDRPFEGLVGLFWYGPLVFVPVIGASWLAGAALTAALCAAVAIRGWLAAFPFLLFSFVNATWSFVFALASVHMCYGDRVPIAVAGLVLHLAGMLVVMASRLGSPG